MLQLKDALAPIFDHFGWVELLPIALWILSGCGDENTRPKTKSSMAGTLLVLHVLCLSVNSRGAGFFRTLFVNPSPLTSMFVVAMPDDETSSVFSGMGSVGWYKCRNGHAYTVGECTMPMQQAYCYACDAPIGGHNHVPVKGTVRMDPRNLNMPGVRGYDADACLSGSYDLIGKGRPTSRLAVAALRYLTHLCLFASCSTTLQGTSAARVLFPSGDIDRALSFLNGRISSDLAFITTNANMPSDDVTVFLHIVLSQLGNTLDDPPASTFASPESRCMLECRFQSELLKVLTGNIEGRIEAARAELQDSNKLSVVKAVYGFGFWTKIHERVARPAAADVFWQLHVPVTYDAFVRAFYLNGRNEAVYPLLAAFIKQEERLPLVRHIAAILAFHALLFEILPPNAISRQQAAAIVNGDVVGRLPEQRREDGRRVLQRHCDAFNTGLALVPNLYECQENPFLTKSGKIDLSGTREGAVLMGEETPVTFSLPSAIQGETDAPGLCTVQILGMLQRTQDDLLSKLELNARNGTAAGGEGDDEADMLLPTISYLSSAATIHRHLIVYAREQHLMPILQACAVRSLSYGEGTRLSFDFSRVQNALANTVFAGKRPVVVTVRHFAYAGELRGTGRMSALQMKVPQDMVAASVVSAIWAEIDTQDRLTQAMAQLEDCVTFLVSIGGKSTASIDPCMKLERFALDVLLVDSVTWSQVATRTISQTIELRHLRSLLLALQERATGNPLDNVMMKYREELPAELRSLLLQAIPRFNLREIVPDLRDFAVDQLCGPKWPADASLKEYLTFSSAHDLDECPWFMEYFPDGLQLAHTFAVYEILAGQAEGPCCNLRAAIGIIEL